MVAPNLPEKKLEKEKRQLESKRDEAWREYDGTAKECDFHGNLRGLCEAVRKAVSFEKRLEYYLIANAKQ
jgi:hypothetical protein